MPELPTGTVTFLFTDIEGSTKLLEQEGERYAQVLDEHRRVLRDAFGDHGGEEVDTQGDAFFVAFARATDAIAAAAQAQDALAIPVRMGIHTGEPQLTAEGYVGMDVHRAARIAGAAHGRQVLVSQATRQLVDDGRLRDLGAHRLKDLSAPERIYQLGDGEFPPLRTLYQTNLPVPATPFVGREIELGQVGELLGRSDVRLLTLTGAGGSGKTRLALQAAGETADEYPQGVWWVPLASVRHATEVAPAAAQALGGGAPLAELVGDRRLLLLLDNFEHVIDAAPEIGALLVACPRLDVLVTSRERLRLRGEQVYPVPVLARAEARRLFVARARAASPDFEPDEHVDDLCARLDDLPLAIELAASRISLLTASQLLERLGQQLDLLRGGRDSEVRQRTLRATIEWSYDLLDDDEKRLLAALAVFRGGWTLEAAERVCDADLELLQSLVDKSLVRRWESGRFGMLETIREFADERLESGRREELLRRLAEHLTQAFEGAHLRPESIGGPRVDLAQEERPNVDVALAWAIDAGAVETGLGLLSMIEMYWITSDPLVARMRVDSLLAAAGEDLDPVVRARALRLRGATFDMTGLFDLSEAEYERARELFREGGDEEQRRRMSDRIAASAAQAGDAERAKRLAQEALTEHRERGDRLGQALSLSILALTAAAEGDRGEAVRLAYESASIAQEVDFMWWRGITLGNAADWLLADGEVEEAAQALRAGLESLASAWDPGNLTLMLATGAAITAGLGDAERAGALWGALDAVAQREPRPTIDQARREAASYLEPVHGPAFDRGRAYGRTLTLEDAVQYALANLD